MFLVLSLLLLLHGMVCGPLFVTNASLNGFSVLSLLQMLHGMVFGPLIVTNAPYNGLWSSPCN